MANNENITITNAIIHMLNKDKLKGGHYLSDYEIDLDDKIIELIKEHIDKAYYHESRMFAKFNGEYNIVKKNCIEIIKNEHNFIEESKKTSRELYSAMKGTNGSSANLLICRYLQDSQVNVAIIKLDFNENFHTDKIENGGKIKIVIRLNGNGFSKSQKLRKCAIINDNILNDEDAVFLLLDTQNNGEVSDYFGNAFLNCEPINNKRINTRNMISEFMSFINSEYEEQPEKMIQTTYLFTDKLNQCDKFNIDDMLNRVFNSEDERSRFKTKVKNKNIDFEFDIDKSLVTKRLNKRTIVTQNGIALKANASLFNSNDIEILEKEDGLSDIVIKDVRINKNKL